MLRYLHWAFHPAALIVGSILLVAAAAVVVLPADRTTAPQPLPVRGDEQEIAWLYPATSTTQWERFAAAVQQAQERLKDQYPGLDWEQDAEGSARKTPQLALAWPGGGQSRLVFRWYKLTSQWTPAAWIDALCKRRRPPLAVIGGNNSYWARQLAEQLDRAAADLPEDQRPLLLITNATADRVLRASTDEERDANFIGSRWSDDSQTLPLLQLYPKRTFRFCFSNRQMATAVTRFIWGRPDLRPDGDPACLAQWTDDSYSQDFFDGCQRVLDFRAVDNGVQQWAFVTGCVGLSLPPAALAGWVTSGFRHETTVRLDIDSSVGSFLSPNPYEASQIREMLNQLPAQPAGRLLLVLTGQQQPSRRLLRTLARSNPDVARAFVVATGDAISFNTIYRDRQVTWPIQDLPFPLVFFAHRNPIDATAGFRSLQASTPANRTRASGTEDVLLFRDIVEATALAYRGDTPAASAADLAAGLRAISLDGDRLQRGDRGVRLFGPNEQRNSGTGEHVVYLKPEFKGDRVLPNAEIQVWARQGSRDWKKQGILTVLYDEFEVHHGDRFPGQ